jgi:hypothetical protein
MKHLRSSRRLVKMWHRREKSTIDQVVSAGTIGDSKGTGGRTHSALTASGLVVEEQVRKAWHPSAVGLAVF